MIYNYTTKYKEREPKETVELIKQFFLNRNFLIQETNLEQSESLTWTVHINLIIDGITIMTSHGKGMTQEFCLASGYAELYERFCNKVNIYNNPLLLQQVYDYNFTNYGYYLYPGEKQLNFDEAFKYPDCKEHFLHQFGTVQNIQTYFNLINPIGFIGVPFHKFDNTTIEYLDLNIYTKLNTSSGLAAGNTLEEALVQGSSELVEHLVKDKIFQYKDTLTYYCLDLNQLQLNEQLKAAISAIEQAGNKLYIYDLSYNFNVPVLMSVIFNAKTCTCSIDLGAFPIFEIALERIITELYQSVISYNIFKEKLQEPSRQYQWYDMLLQEVTCLSRTMAIPEEILYHKEIKDNYNQEVFLTSKEYTNKDLYQYYIELYQKNNLEVYYLDTSLSSDIAAVNIICVNQKVFSALEHEFDYLSVKEKTDMISVLSHLYKYILSDLTDIDELSHLQSINPFLFYLCRVPWENLYGENNDICPYGLWNNLAHGYMVSENEMVQCSHKTMFETPMRAFLTAKRYYNTKQYSEEEIIKWFQELNIDFSKIKWYNINNNKYIYEQVIVNTYQKYKNSPAVKNFIEGSCKIN